MNAKATQGGNIELGMNAGKAMDIARHGAGSSPANAQQQPTCVGEGAHRVAAAAAGSQGGSHHSAQPHICQLGSTVITTEQDIASLQWSGCNMLVTHS